MQNMYRKGEGAVGVSGCGEGGRRKRTAVATPNQEQAKVKEEALG